MGIRNYLLFILLGCFIFSCKNEKSSKQYKMYLYESKANVDSADFPLIKIFNNNKVEIIKPNEKFQGKIITKNEAEVIKLSDGSEMKVEFNKQKNEIIVYSLVHIDVEAKYGNFKIVE